MAATRYAREVPSGSALRESVSFRDDTGANFTPTTVEYRVFNRGDDTEITAGWQTVSSPSFDMTIVFPGTLFNSEIATLDSEVHEVTLFADRGESGFKQAIVYDVTVTRAGV